MSSSVSPAARFGCIRIAAAASAIAALFFCGAFLSSFTVQAGSPGYFGYGRTPTAAEIAGWDIDVRGKDGVGLPAAKAPSVAAPAGLPTNARPATARSAKAKAVSPS